ncbi:ABC transporter permease [Salinicoccus sp. ID82-1]|uniref:ABC transporter permease n=1 Tax=Salinicoccus cyprini TaxID=2493691 RepID=A0A558ARR2_9STAP|nr:MULTISPECIES: ABC transporter permease [Salinicoccus]MCG1009489.1 ABC transporter permease [Salinicoccus sp. ID82-1]TVT26926.1 ABC transporter permease [Salinicoccus cyprini]
MNTGRIMAIFEKDLKEFTRNMMLFTTILLPIFLAFMYSRMGDGEAALPAMLVYLIVGVAFSAILCSGIMTMMAEENEKNTLRGLIQSPASMMDILIGKSLVVTLMTAASLTAAFLLMNAALEWSVASIGALLLLALFFLNVGIAVGLTVDSVATTSVYLLPIMFIFGFTPMVEIVVPEPDHFVRQITDYLPLYQNIAIHDGETVVPLLILAAWTLASFLYVTWAFRKRMSDEAK